MTILITMKHVQLIKKELGLNLPHIKSSHRAEAMARGLGWKSNAALRAALMCGPADCIIDDDAFAAYLTAKDFPGADNCRFSAIVKKVSDEDFGPISAAYGSEVRSAGRINLNTKWAALAFGLFAVIGYLFLTMQTADDYLDQAIDNSLDVAANAAIRSVLIMDRDLGQEIVEGLLEHPYISEAEILDDHGDPFAVRRQSVVAQGFLERLQDLLTWDKRVEYQRILEMPPTLSGTPGRLKVTVNKAKARAILPGPTWSGIISALVLGIVALVSLIAGQSAFKGWMRLYLAQHYRLAHL